MNPPDYTKIVEDCDSALKLDRRYVKALNRRGSALESLERYEEALAGTCIPILHYITIHTHLNRLYCGYYLGQVPNP